MALKDDILFELMISSFVSGEGLAEKYYVSRNSIWKAVKQLRDEGFEIEAVTNKGYCLKGDINKITAGAIKKGLKSEWSFEILPETDSTNNYAKELAISGKRNRTVVITEKQNGGKGRLGRPFYSPEGNGLYMSVLCRPEINVDCAPLITSFTAVAVAKAIEKLSGQDVNIKWVNDVYMNGKKICGILTEAVTDFESGSLQYAVMGLGVNISRPKGGFPSEISDIASSLYSEEAAGNELKCALAAEILNNFFDICERMSVEKLTEEYKSYSVVLGKRIRVISSNAEYYATAVDIDKNARLIVRDENGDMHTLSSAEVSVREGQI